MKTLSRCPWPVANDPLYVSYHDEEWGVPVYDDRRLFEFLVLESFQAGLSWQIILRKRENFRRAFHAFDPVKIARYTDRDRAQLLQDAGIVRNRAKIDATIQNAKCFLTVQKEFGSFARYMWTWVGGKPLVHRFRSMRQVPPTTQEAAAWARDLKQRGFRFLGPTVVYAHMQAVGMVNDHLTNCFRHASVQKSFARSQA